MLGTCGFSLRRIHALKDRMLERKLLRLVLVFGEDVLLHLLEEVVELAVAPEIVNHQEAAVER